ncbi:hypothetical protein CVT26_000580 [Gymnopilus dilepis]|uniref:Uncharacterized protein n=1 Tax=Gymnopilus dilepis TaxID=231916 RepID=A0A409VH97_9AGAR|nr:hypothetical protein CVT26_000580 [Gymnopilus dilepis]
MQPVFTTIRPRDLADLTTTIDTRHAIPPNAIPKKIRRAPSPLIYPLEITFYTAQDFLAASDIQADQLIFVERSLSLSRRFGIRPAQFGEEIVREWEKQLRAASRQIAGDDRALFGDLSIAECSALSLSSQVLTPLMV